MIEELFRQSERFRFFQAVRLLELHAAHHERFRETVGKDGAPAREIVRFRALPALSFPGSEIARLTRPKQANGGGEHAAPLEMTVSFLGLTGPSGVLPRHYTTLVLERFRERDHALADFLDLFNHRVISHFYRAWEKYRFPFAFERARAAETDDLFTLCLRCLVGFGTDGLTGRLQVDDRAPLFHGGHFANQTRTAESLESILNDYFELPIRIQQFEGQWLYLMPENQSRLSAARKGRGFNARLGRDAVVGERVWDAQSKFRIRIGPLSYRDFRRLMPIGDVLQSLVELTRSFVGPEFDFDVQLVLRAGEVPACQLGGDDDAPPCLGWNSWLRAEAFSRDAADSVFVFTAI